MRPAHEFSAAAFLYRDAFDLTGFGTGATQAALHMPFAVEAYAKNAPTAIWVELTGRPSHEAMITVIAAERATQ